MRVFLRGVAAGAGATLGILGALAAVYAGVTVAEWWLASQLDRTTVRPFDVDAPWNKLEQRYPSCEHRPEVFMEGYAYPCHCQKETQ